MMIPHLKQKIWYAFQGLPFEQINSTDRLPWSKCLVLTNNLMQILQFTQLTESFKRNITRSSAEENKGVTFEEYIAFIDNYLCDHNKVIGPKDTHTNPLIPDSETSATNISGTKANTIESHAPINLNTYGKAESGITPLIKNFDDYCWTLYRTKNIQSLTNTSPLYDGFFNLWLLFVTYSMKSVETGETIIPVQMDIVEAKYWSNRVRELLGARRQFDDVEIEETVTSIQYKEFYFMFQNIFKNVCLAESVVDIALRDLAEEALDGMTMKGPIKIERYTRFCVLKSFLLMIYNHKTSPVNFRSCFVISSSTELLAGTNKIQMKTPGFTFVTTVNIEIADVQLFNKWRSALSDAIIFAKSNVTNPAMAEAKKREETRQIKRSSIKTRRLFMDIKLEDERKERCELTEVMELQLRLADEKLENFRHQMRKQLYEKEILIKQNEHERQETEAHIKNVIQEQQSQYSTQMEKLRDIENEKNSLKEKLQATMEERSNEETKWTLLEEQHTAAQHMLQEAKEKIATLEKLREQLEKALEEEKQAKEEEEAVRNATLALLEEEQRSKENLEVLLRQQNNIIDLEIQKRTEFAQELENEKCRIQSIAEEKEKLAKQLEETQQKMQSTGNRVRKLDTKVAQIAENVFGKEQTRFPVSHRGKGFLAENMAQPKN